MVEAACKTLATQRLKRSGMSWRDGKQAISPFVVSNRATDELQLGRFPLHTSALESLRSVSTVTCENWSWPRRLPSELGRCEFQGYTHVVSHSVQTLTLQHVHGA